MCRTTRPSAFRGNSRDFTRTVERDAKQIRSILANRTSSFGDANPGTRFRGGFRSLIDFQPSKTSVLPLAVPIGLFRIASLVRVARDTDAWSRSRLVLRLAAGWRRYSACRVSRSTAHLARLPSSCLFGRLGQMLLLIQSSYFLLAHCFCYKLAAFLLYVLAESLFIPVFVSLLFTLKIRWSATLEGHYWFQSFSLIYRSIFAFLVVGFSFLLFMSFERESLMQAAAFRAQVFCVRPSDWSRLWELRDNRVFMFWNALRR